MDDCSIKGHVPKLTSMQIDGTITGVLGGNLNHPNVERRNQVSGITPGILMMIVGNHLVEIGVGSHQLGMMIGILDGSHQLGTMIGTLDGNLNGTMIGNHHQSGMTIGGSLHGVAEEEDGSQTSHRIGVEGGNGTMIGTVVDGVRKRVMILHYVQRSSFRLWNQL